MARAWPYIANKCGIASDCYDANSICKRCAKRSELQFVGITIFLAPAHVVEKSIEYLFVFPRRSLRRNLRTSCMPISKRFDYGDISIRICTNKYDHKTCTLLILKIRMAQITKTDMYELLHCEILLPQIITARRTLFYI